MREVRSTPDDLATLVSIVLALLVLSVVAALVFVVIGRAAAKADRNEESEVLAMFGRLGRRSGDRRRRADRRKEPWLPVERERRRGQRREAADRRDPLGPRDDRGEAQPEHQA